MYPSYSPGMLGEFLYNQLLFKLPIPSSSWAGRTVIVTGANAGLGREAARHFVRLGAAKTILAVRSLGRGEAAKTDILQSTNQSKDSTDAGNDAAIEVWQLDMSSYALVKDFAARVNRDLTRVDAIVENAGVIKSKFSIEEEDEATITVNVVSTFLLALLLTPKLKETAAKFNTTPVLTVVASEVHAWTAMKHERKYEASGKIFDALKDPQHARMDDRYNVSKLLEVLCVREIARQHPYPKSLPFLINTVNPGLCHSELGRNMSGLRSFVFEALKSLVARSTEAGSRTYVRAAEMGIRLDSGDEDSGEKCHGAYMSNCQVAEPSPFVRSEEGQAVQKSVWSELAEKLEKIEPGILKNLEA